MYFIYYRILYICLNFFGSSFLLKFYPIFPSFDFRPSRLKRYLYRYHKRKMFIRNFLFPFEYSYELCLTLKFFRVVFFQLFYKRLRVVLVTYQKTLNTTNNKNERSEYKLRKRILQYHYYI